MNELSNYTLTILKGICKLMSIKKYTGLKKCDTMLLILKHQATIRIQKWIRKKLSKGEPCPISLEKIHYPCFAFKTTNNVLIYYNLYPLKHFLIRSGDFLIDISLHIPFNIVRV